MADDAAGPDRGAALAAALASDEDDYLGQLPPAELAAHGWGLAAAWANDESDHVRFKAGQAFMKLLNFLAPLTGSDPAAAANILSNMPSNMPWVSFNLYAAELLKLLTIPGAAALVAAALPGILPAGAPSTAGLWAAEHQPELVLRLLQTAPAGRRLNFSAVSAGGQSLAHAAVAGGHSQLLRELTDAKVDMAVQNAAGQTVLEVAAGCKHPAVVEWARTYGTYNGEYRLAAGRPDYNSATSDVHHGREVLGRQRKVAVKVMRRKADWGQELKARGKRTLDPAFVVEVYACFVDAAGPTCVAAVL